MYDFMSCDYITVVESIAGIDYVHTLEHQCSYGGNKNIESIIRCGVMWAVVMWCDVMWCVYIIRCDVMWCDMVMFMYNKVWCDVMCIYN